MNGGGRGGGDRGVNGGGRGGGDRGVNGGGHRGGSGRQGGGRQGADWGEGGGDRDQPRGQKVRGRSPAPESARTSGDFWGDPARLPPVSEVAVSADGSAVVRSLGRPPITGHEAASEYYLRMACDRAVNLAAVLATAGDLLDDEDPE